MKCSPTKVDLTPMVHLGFLLITFFLFSTTMSQITAMDILQPADGPDHNVPSSGSLTFLLGKDNSIHFYEGRLEDAIIQNRLGETNFKYLRSIIMQKKMNTDLDDLMFLIKIFDEAKLGNKIDLLDEMVICEIPKGHYAEVDISAEEELFIKKGRF